MSKLQRTAIDGIVAAIGCVCIYYYIALAEAICRALGVGA